MQKSSKNNSIKGRLEEPLYIALEGAPKIPLEEAQKIVKNLKKNMHLTLHLMVHLPMQSRLNLSILNLALHVSVIFYVALNKQNCRHFQIRFH